MKKVLFAFVLTLAVCACSSNNGTYDISYVDFTDEEKALFEQEIGVNDKLLQRNTKSVTEASLMSLS